MSKVNKAEAMKMVKDMLDYTKYARRLLPVFMALHESNGDIPGAFAFVLGCNRETGAAVFYRAAGYNRVVRRDFPAVFSRWVESPQTPKLKT